MSENAYNLIKLAILVAGVVGVMFAAAWADKKPAVYHCATSHDPH